MSAAAHIDTFSLFGETGELSDLLHIETIEARSALHDWSLTPHRHDRLHQILILTEGGGTANIDGTNHSLAPPCLLNLPRGVVHGFQFESGTNGWVLTVTSDLLDHCLRHNVQLRTALEMPGIAPLQPGLQQMIECIANEHDQHAPFRAPVLTGLVGASAGMVVRAISAQQHKGSGPRGHRLFFRFQELVEQAFRCRKGVAEYAAELAVSPTHLNRVCHQETGKSASHLIKERMLREARRLLIYTTLSAAEVAYELGFSDPAHFSRVFAKATGQPPRRFRQKMTAGG
jgi:AraC family transcriptional activator of pobA